MWFRPRGEMTMLGVSRAALWAVLGNHVWCRGLYLTTGKASDLTLILSLWPSYLYIFNSIMFSFSDFSVPLKWAKLMKMLVFDFDHIA